METRIMIFQTFIIPVHTTDLSSVECPLGFKFPYLYVRRSDHKCRESCATAARAPTPSSARSFSSFNLHYSDYQYDAGTVCRCFKRSGLAGR